MSANKAALDFLEKCKATASVDAVAEMLFAELAALGYAYVACCSHVDPLKPPAGAVSMINYPIAWLTQFSQEKYAARDPVFQSARTTATPFHWSDLLRGKTLLKDQKQILSEAATYGIEGGLTIPIHWPDALPASCSLVPGPDGVDPLTIPSVLMMAFSAHDAARRCLGVDGAATSRLLSPRERQCLTLAGLGKSDWTIGELLGINSRTVHNTIERAKKRFGVAFRVQAVVRAVVEGQIPIDDLSE